MYFYFFSKHRGLEILKEKHMTTPHFCLDTMVGEELKILFVCRFLVILE